MATLKEKYKLPKAFKTKWIKALRSGKYEQGTGYLKTTHVNDIGEISSTYCCLGVAGEICGVKMSEKGKGFLTNYSFPDIHKIPKSIQGVPANNSLVKKLANMNDEGKSFKYIASYIERYL